MRSLRVLLMSPLPPPYGGISHWTTRLLEVLADRPDLEVRVLDTSPGPRAATTGLVYRIATGVRRMVSDTGSLGWALRARRPDVVHINTSGSLAFARDLAVLRLLALAGIPSVLHLHFGRVPALSTQRGWEGRLMRLAVRSATTVVSLDAPTHAVVSRLRPGREDHCLPNFVEIPDAGPPAGSRDQSCLFVGWVLTSKGIEDLAAAWSSIDTDGWVLDVIGPLGTEPGVAALVAEPPAGITFVGEVSHAQVMDRMRRCGLFVLPSHTEGFPNVVAEAMSVGTPILASAVGAIPDMLAEGAGLTVPAHDVATLAEALQRLMCDPVLRRSMAEHAARRAREKYSTAVVTESYVGMWRELAAHRTGIRSNT